ncbi:MAG: RNA polymerase sigma factor [Gammaproteobacteria bacterium]|jgi:RNA polymerase sigma factor (sigma-70 family)|nr:RNA polymerase sigma factor [Gammaproteobacteria bacterium]
MDSNEDKLTGKALNELLASELSTMRKFTYSLTGSVDDSHDVVQIAMERCLRSGVPREGSRSWLFTVCKNLWIDEIRRRRRKPQNEFQEDIDTPVSDFAELNSTEASVARRDELNNMAAAFSQLTDDHRIPLAMSAIDGMGYKEIAIALEIPVGTVMSRIARARITLNKRLRRLGDD